MRTNKYFVLGEFSLSVHHDTKQHKTDICVSFPFYSLKYSCMDVASYSWHWCDHNRDENGFCVHRPYHFKGGAHAKEIIEAFRAGKDLKNIGK